MDFSKFPPPPSSSSSEEEDEGEVGVWDDWDEGSHPECLCLFCDQKFSDARNLFEHCGSEHGFDFGRVAKEQGLDFYGKFRFINYVREKVNNNKSWRLGSDFSKHDWESERYLKPFLLDDALLHCFADDEFDEDEGCSVPIDEEELAGLIKTVGIGEGSSCSPLELNDINGVVEEAAPVNGVANKSDHLKEDNCSPQCTLDGNDKQLKLAFASVAAKDLKNVNEYYFGAYGSYGIHREMISDKVRMDAYRGAILNNPSLLNQATVMDVGCGTGILSLFAAQAGASKVFAIEASKKMSSMAKQIIKHNGRLANEMQSKEQKGVIEVVQGMVEDLDKIMMVPPHSIDVLVSEWMGYCLLYETMLGSVLYARDRWLKPGGAILPDTATIFVAGFGKGGTSIPFWEDVYGFDMSCIGKELLEDAARVPIVDVVNSNDILTDSVTVQTFDMATMKPEDVDFTANFELKLKSGPQENSSCAVKGINWCYGIVLWFETAFTSRFCKEMPTVLSTSPYSPKTHWSQTIFTFQQPIALAPSDCVCQESTVVGTKAGPAVRLESRISIARALVHRSIDISLEVTGVDANGRKHGFPIQVFNL